MFAIRSFNHPTGDSPFTTRPTREFLLVVDRREPATSVQQVIAARLLEKIISHRTFAVLNYGGTQVPASIERVTDSFTHKEYPIGWIEVERIDGDPAPMYWAHYAEADGSWSASWLGVPFVTDEEIAEIASRTPGWDGPRSSEDVLSGALAQSAAAGVNADLLVSANKNVLGVTRLFGAEVTVCDFNTACLLVGLYLRTVGVHLVFSPNSAEGYELNAGLFYEAAALSICPSVGSLRADLIDRIERGLDSSDDPERNNQHDAALVRATLSRLARSLAARDAMLRCCLLPASEGALHPIDQVAAELDSSMILLAGAFDALAQICNGALGIDADVRISKWQAQQWRHKIIGADSDFSDLLRDDSPTVRLIEIMGVLRNEIHGIGVGGASYVSRNRKKSLVLRLRGESAEKFARKLREAELDSSLVIWHTANDLLIDPIRLAKQFYPRLTGALNQLAEHLGRVMSQRHGMERSDGPLKAFPALNSSVDVSSIEESIRLQMGLFSAECEEMAADELG